jgi:uncharacterized membrane protein
MSENYAQAEELIHTSAQWLRLGVETTGALIVGIGVLVALFQLLRAVRHHQTANFNAIRLILARYLALALEFQLGADILSTAIAPTSKEIGQLAAIAVIRTGLNYFLSLEMKQESSEVHNEEKVKEKAASPESS